MHTPPLTLTPRPIDLVSRISEALGRWEGAAVGLSPKLSAGKITMTVPDSPHSPKQRYRIA